MRRRFPGTSRAMALWGGRTFTEVLAGCGRGRAGRGRQPERGGGAVLARRGPDAGAGSAGDRRARACAAVAGAAALAAARRADGRPAATETAVASRPSPRRRRAALVEDDLPPCSHRCLAPPGRARDPPSHADAPRGAVLESAPGRGAAHERLPNRRGRVERSRRASPARQMPSTHPLASCGAASVENLPGERPPTVARPSTRRRRGRRPGATTGAAGTGGARSRSRTPRRRNDGDGPARERPASGST